MSWSPFVSKHSITSYVHYRREALRMWQRKLGSSATYGKLLEVFVQAGHTECAEALCEVIKMKCEQS